MRVFRLFFILLIISLISATSAYIIYDKALNKELAVSEDGFILEIKKGQTLNSVLNELKKKKVLQTLWPSKVYARVNNLAGRIQAGEFNISRPMSFPELLDYISANNQVTYSIQFIEGLSYKDALSTLISHDKLEHELNNVSEADIVKKLGIENSDHLEGQFYPDTYHFHKGDSDLDILMRSHQRLRTILEEEWAKRQENLPLENAYEALILASIIEKETGVPEERSEISGVFIRRLLKNMRLQTDPTVIYGLGDTYQGNITRKHLTQYTAYNTYRISGLPPTPIALVGRAAIHAALNPKQGKSLYFVAKGDGSHYFSETIAEHNKAVRQYQLKRRSDYRSSVQ